MGQPIRPGLIQISFAQWANLARARFKMPGLIETLLFCKKKNPIYLPELRIEFMLPLFEPKN